MHLNEKQSQILAQLAITELNPMQLAAGKAIRENHDTLLLSPTGSGKTLAFLLPIVEMLNSKEGKVQCLILTPSRELAIQIEQVWKKMATGFKVSCCYGGHDMQTEIQNLAEPPALLIGTPGRIGDHIKRITFDTAALTMLVFDEFDKSLALGFEEEMAYIVQSIKTITKRVFASATDTIQIPAFAGVEQLTVIDFLKGKADTAALTIKQVISEEKDKVNKLFDLLCFLDQENAIIFCNHRDAVERTSQLLKEKGVDNVAFHGGMEQKEREQALIQFRNGSMRYMVATDLAARGLDIADMRHVIHFHRPSTEAEFTHRNGRTARMQETGNAYLLMHTDEPLPHYIHQKPAILSIPVSHKPPKAAEWVTLYINGGKKDKLNKVDIVGFFSQKGQLQKDELGLIIVKDFNAFVAVKKHSIKKLLPLVQPAKIKGTRYKIVVAK